MVGLMPSTKLYPVSQGYAYVCFVARCVCGGLVDWWTGGPVDWWTTWEVDRWIDRWRGTNYWTRTTMKKTRGRRERKPLEAASGGIIAGSAPSKGPHDAVLGAIDHALRGFRETASTL